ncbi:MAG: bifunctional ornithine acetyltransferase/N-acetylglutamate synthase [Anaerofustis sp.]
MKIINGGITSPKGYKAAGLACGIKARKKDMSLIVSDVPCVSAAAFTTNVVKAAPVLYNQSVYVNKSTVSCILTNSGNANACTGEEGAENTKRMADIAAEALGISSEEIFVNSTGVIGVQLPMEKVEAGIRSVASNLGSDDQSAAEAAEAIMTTDTFPKTVCVQIELSGKPVTIAAMAKGSGMIHPNMATMLSFITTDVSIDQDTFRAILADSIIDSYNMLSVDGDTSTNDSVIALANGLAGNDIITADSAEYEIFAAAFHYVNRTVAKLIAKDGEGASKLLIAHVEHAKTKEDARKLALSVIKSSLTKAAFFGQDANWGRVLCAMGYSGAQFDPNSVVLHFESAAGSILLFDRGVPLQFDEEKALTILKENEIHIRIDMTEGVFSAESFGCDLTYDYVKINGEYRS